jgi:hypothetical protein
MMKKEILFLFLFILSLSFTSSLSLDLKNSYEPSETVIIKISGNIIDPIKKDQVIFSRGYIEVPVEYDIAKLGQDYYIWFIAPMQNNNYSLTLKDISTTIAGQPGKIDYSQNFSVYGNYSYNIKPGFFITPGKIDLLVKSFVDEDIEIKSNIGGQIIKLNPGENNLNYNIEQSNDDRLIFVTIGKYSLPVYISKNATYVDNQYNGVYPTDKLAILPKKISTIQYVNASSQIFSFLVYNPSNKEIENIRMDFNGLLVYPDEVFNLAPNETKQFNLTVYGKNNFDNIYSVNFSHSGEIDTFYLEVNYTSNRELINTTYYANDSSPTLPYCRAIYGVICDSDSSCNSTAIKSQEGDCCQSICIKKSSTSGYSWLAYLLIAIVLIVSVYLWFRYKGAKPEANILTKKF